MVGRTDLSRKEVGSARVESEGKEDVYRTGRDLEGLQPVGKRFTEAGQIPGLKEEKRRESTHTVAQERRVPVWLVVLSSLAGLNGPSGLSNVGPDEDVESLEGGRDVGCDLSRPLVVGSSGVRVFHQLAQLDGRRKAQPGRTHKRRSLVRKEQIRWRKRKGTYEIVQVLVLVPSWNCTSNWPCVNSPDSSGTQSFFRGNGILKGEYALRQKDKVCVNKQATKVM
jgi:hypothetical protein